VTRGQCDARPTVTFPAKRHHRPLAGTINYTAAIIISLSAANSYGHLVCLLQGFHDIVVTFLLVVGEDLTFAIMNKLCQRHLRYCRLYLLNCASFANQLFFSSASNQKKHFDEQNGYVMRPYFS